MSNWIKLSARELDKRSEDRGQGGIKIEVSLSPYDIPQAVRGFYSEKEREFRIEFKYLEEEAIRRQPVRDHVKVFIGKNSGRLYGFAVDVDRLGVSKVELVTRLREEIDQALEKIPSRTGSSRNSDVGAEVYHRYRDRLITEENVLSAVA